MKKKSPQTEIFQKKKTLDKTKGKKSNPQLKYYTILIGWKYHTNGNNTRYCWDRNTHILSNFHFQSKQHLKKNTVEKKPPPSWNITRYCYSDGNAHILSNFRKQPKDTSLSFRWIHCRGILLFSNYKIGNEISSGPNSRLRHVSDILDLLLASFSMDSTNLDYISIKPFDGHWNGHLWQFNGLITL